MQLSYRGVKYDVIPSIITEPVTDRCEIWGRYRGATIRFRTRVSLPTAPVQLSYRDATYLSFC